MSDSEEQDSRPKDGKGTIRLTVRLNEDELSALDDLAERFHWNRQLAIRLLVRARLLGEDIPI